MQQTEKSSTADTEQKTARPKGAGTQITDEFNIMSQLITGVANPEPENTKVAGVLASMSHFVHAAEELQLELHEAFLNDCNDKKTEGACGSGCLWEDETCKFDCAAIDTDTKCTADVGCDWDPSGGGSCKFNGINSDTHTATP